MSEAKSGARGEATSKGVAIEAKGKERGDERKVVAFTVASLQAPLTNLRYILVGGPRLCSSAPRATLRRLRR